MEKIFFILLILILFKYLLTIFLILRKFKKSSYIVEIIISGLICYVTYAQNQELKYAIPITITEYFFSKILVLLFIIKIKKLAFALIISVTHNGSLSKILCLFFNKRELCKKLNFLHKINYGPHLKHGLPAMARTKHPKTKVKYDRKGFPIFHSYYTLRLPIWDYKKSRQAHFSHANKVLYKKALKSKKIRKLFTQKELNQLKSGITPSKYTWHHHQTPGKMQLVSYKKHVATHHIGGYGIWGMRE